MAIKRTNIGGDPGSGIPPVPSGYYFYTASQNNSTTSNALAVGMLRLSPWQVTRAISLDQLGADVATIGDVGSKFRIGLYADTGNAMPGSLILDAGTINGDSPTVQAVSVSLTLQAGIYWIGGVVQIVTTTQPTMRTIQASSYNPPIVISPGGTTLASLNAAVIGVNQTGVTGALPSTFASTGATTNVPRVLARMA